MKQLSETEGKIKEAKNIENSGTALMAMVEIVEEHLAHHNKVQQN